MYSYTLEPISFKIVHEHDGKWWPQEVADAHKIVSSDIPTWIDIVVHRGVTEQRYPADYYTVSDLKTGARIEVDPEWDQDTVVQQAIAHLQMKTEEEYNASVQVFLDRQSTLLRIRAKRLKKRTGGHR